MMKPHIRSIHRKIAVAVLATICAAGTAQATLLEIDYTTGGAFSGTPPAGMSTSAVFAKAVFDDGGSSGIVTLTMSVLSGITGMPSGAYVNDWYFNVDPTLASGASTGVTVAYASGQIASSIGNSTDAFKADGTGGAFDLYFEFPTSNPGQLGQGLSSVYTLTGTGITADTFNFLSPSSPPTAGNGGAISAIHLQGYTSSVWIAGTGGRIPPEEIPEPGVLALVSVALLGLGAVSARRRCA